MPTTHCTGMTKNGPYILLRKISKEDTVSTCLDRAAIPNKGRRTGLILDWSWNFLRPYRRRAPSSYTPISLPYSRLLKIDASRNVTLEWCTNPSWTPSYLKILRFDVSLEESVDPLLLSETRTMRVFWFIGTCTRLLPRTIQDGVEKAWTSLRVQWTSIVTFWYDDLWTLLRILRKTTLS